MTQRNLGILKGRVEIINHPELDDRSMKGWSILFQRVDCKNCACGVWTDLKGDYKIILATGTYRVISDDPITLKSCLADDQSRYVTIPYIAGKGQYRFQHQAEMAILATAGS